MENNKPSWLRRTVGKVKDKLKGFNDKVNASAAQTEASMAKAGLPTPAQYMGMGTTAASAIPKPASIGSAVSASAPTFADNALAGMKGMSPGAQKVFLENLSKNGISSASEQSRWLGEMAKKFPETIANQAENSANVLKELDRVPKPKPEQIVPPTAGLWSAIKAGLMTKMPAAVSYGGPLAAGAVGAYKINSAKNKLGKDIDAEMASDDARYKQNMELVMKARQLPEGSPERERLMEIVSRYTGGNRNINKSSYPTMQKPNRAVQDWYDRLPYENLHKAATDGMGREAWAMDQLSR